jgi:hypothetical protein
MTAGNASKKAYRKGRIPLPATKLPITRLLMVGFLLVIAGVSGHERTGGG